MAIQQVIKRNGNTVPYDASKIKLAISKANKEVPELERVSEAYIDYILTELDALNQDTIAIEAIQDFIEAKLIEANKSLLAKKYIVYRYQRDLIRRANTTDESILALVRNKNKEV
jgi:ribonucleoside-triphosphate reductase